MQIPVSKMLLDQGQALDLQVVAGERGLERTISESELNRPGLAFAGFLDVFTYDRVQILGNTETSYLAQMSPEEAEHRLRPIFQFPIPCFIFTHGNSPPASFVAIAEEFGVPLLTSGVPTSRFSSQLSVYLEREFAPSMSIHGVFVDVFGLGVVIMGNSGVGKSEIGLELIERGHRLIADDAIMLRRVGKGTLIGSALNQMQHHMEVRGLGFVDIELLFGFGAIREAMSVSLVVELIKRSDATEEEEERFRENERTVRFLDVDVHQYRLPVEPGRNTSIVIEVAALQHRILAHGRDPQKELNEMLIRQMSARQFSTRK